jgi:hypothetical protein
MKSTTIAELLSECKSEAKRQGASADAWSPEDADLEWVAKRIGRKPTRQEWADAGFPNVGSKHTL